MLVYRVSYYRAFTVLVLNPSLEFIYGFDVVSIFTASAICLVIVMALLYVPVMMHVTSHSMDSFGYWLV